MKKPTREEIIISLGLLVFVIWLAFSASENNRITAIIGGITALGGAWAGGRAAFNAEARRRDQKEREEQIASANSTIFTISLIIDMLENMQTFYANPARNLPDKALRMNSPQPGLVEKITFDFAQLTFLMGKNDICAQSLMELSHLQWHFHVTLQTINLRAEAREEYEKARKINPANIPTTDVNAFVNGLKLLYPEFIKLDALTNQFIDLVDEGIKLGKQTNEKIQKALLDIFPNQNFLQIKSATQDEKIRELEKIDAGK